MTSFAFEQSNGRGAGRFTRGIGLPVELVFCITITSKSLCFVTESCCVPVLLPFRAERLDGLGRVARRPPHARALREHLHAVAADRRNAVDRRVDAAGRAHVRPELHGCLR